MNSWADQIEELREVLDYDSATGCFTWKITIGRAKVGRVAGSFDKDGYIRIKFKGSVYKAHNLVWFFHTGKWPELGLDHKNLVKDDNRFTNLRPATKSQNSANRPLVVRSVPKGVIARTPNRFEAKICVQGKTTYLGSFRTAEEAGNAYSEAAIKHFGEFARLA